MKVWAFRGNLHCLQGTSQGHLKRCLAMMWTFSKYKSKNTYSRRNNFHCLVIMQIGQAGILALKSHFPHQVFSEEIVRFQGVTKLLTDVTRKTCQDVSEHIFNLMCLCLESCQQRMESLLIDKENLDVHIQPDLEQKCPPRLWVRVTLLFPNLSKLS